MSGGGSELENAIGSYESGLRTKRCVRVWEKNSSKQGVSDGVNHLRSIQTQGADCRRRGLEALPRGAA